MALNLFIILLLDDTRRNPEGDVISNRESLKQPDERFSASSARPEESAPPVYHQSGGETGRYTN